MEDENEPRSRSRAGFCRRHRHADCNVVAAGRVVAGAAAAVVLAVRADAVEQVTALARPVDERLAGEEIVRDDGQIFRSELVELGGKATVVGTISGEGEGEE